MISTQDVGLTPGAHAHKDDVPHDDHVGDHEDDDEDDDDDDEEHDDDDAAEGCMRLEEPRVGLGRGGSRVDQFGNNVAGRKPAAVSLKTHAASGSHTKVEGFGALWAKQAAKRQRAQEEAVEGAGAVREGIGRTESGEPSPPLRCSLTLTSPDVAIAPPYPDLGSQGTLFAMIESLKLSLTDTMTSAVQVEIVPALRSAIDNLLREASVSIQAATKVATDAVQLDRELLKVHTQLAVLKSDLVAVLPNGNVICVLCTENVSTVVDLRMLKSKWIGSNGGLNIDSRLVQKYNEHIISDIHGLCVDCAQSRLKDPLRKAAALVRERENQVMTTLFKAASYANIHHQSLRQYEHFIHFLDSESVDVGECGHSRHTAKNLSIILAECAQDKMKTYTFGCAWIVACVVVWWWANWLLLDKTQRLSSARAFTPRPYYSATKYQIRVGKRAPVETTYKRAQYNFTVQSERSEEKFFSPPR